MAENRSTDERIKFYRDALREYQKLYEELLLIAKEQSRIIDFFKKEIIALRSSQKGATDGND